MFPNANAHPLLRFVHASRVLFGLALVLVLAASIPGFSGSRNAQASVITPVLESAVVFADNGLISIHGEGFSPGGLVQIVFANQGGEALHAPRWTVASAAAYGPHGSQDPARGYVPAGSFTEIINLGAGTVYGPNGSQDPAQVYRPAPDAGSLLATGTITVRAFDQQTSLWSNLATVDPAGLLAIQETGQIRYDVPQACVAFIPCNQSF